MSGSWSACSFAAAAMCLMALLGCAREVDPAAVSGAIVAFGRYELQKGLPIPVEATTQIECTPGVTFGVDFRIDVANGEFGTVPIEFRWAHPELAVPSKKLWGTESPARLPNPVLEWRKSSFSGRSLWSLEHPDERISGRYEFIVRRTNDRTTVISQAFDVQGC